MRHISCLLIFFLFSATQAYAAPYDDVKSLMYELEKAYPDNVSTFKLPSDSGDDIVGIKVGSGPVANLLVATHHGNEYGSTEVAKAFAESVAADPLEGQSLYIIPVLNIGGYNRGRREEIAKNVSHDPNRDYPGPCGTEGPFNLKSTYALAQFVAEKNIVASATLHTYTPAVLYPWGISTQDTQTPYDDIFIYLGEISTVESGYRVGNSTLLLYPADGTFEDYAFWKHGIWSLLFEMGHTHYPGDNQIEDMIRVNVPGLRNMFLNAPTKRAENHKFEGQCDLMMKLLDLHSE